MSDVDLEVYGAPDLTYDFGAADAVASAANAAANHIEDQSGSRISNVATANTDFQGHFSQLFAANAEIAASDARELVFRLRDIASFIGRLNDAAREENARRRRAREWRDRVEARRSNWLDATWDDIFGEEPPPTAGPIDPPVFQSTALTPSTRQTPAPGSGGGGGGTSSARPENLRTFANGNAELDAGLSAHPGRLTEWTGDFMRTCDFGGIDVSPVVAGFRAWLDANANDVAWANTIAQAFEDAGTNGGVGTVSD
ncbi:MAG: Rhs family protein, partial [Microbacterium sp.]|nr:Rhs family protein [Microbacterium sp.]